MEPDTDPEYAIDQINSFISKIADLQQMDCENPDSESEIAKLKINIRGFLRANFKDDDKKLKDLEKDRSSFATRHFLDPIDPVTRQRNYENDLELIKNHLIVYKTELESINYSRRKRTPSVNNPSYSISTQSTEENLNKSSPIEIQESLKKIRADFPDPKKVAFIMMQFGETKEHTDILISLRKTLTENGLSGVRADDKTYHDDKLYNILTYLHGCGFGIAVFETITDQSFNPNVSLESGYLMGLHKPICLLKEKKLKTLPSDLVGRLYHEFSIEQCDLTISNVLRNWLSDKDLSGN